MTRRSVVVAVLASLAVTSALVVASWRPTAAVPFGAAVTSSDAPATPIPIPIPGHEVYGYVPYWEMDDGIAGHLADTDLTTLGLFSVTHKKSGALANEERGYRRITDDLGRRLVREAHERGVRVELVYTSFGSKKNAVFFGNATAQDRTIRELVELRDDLGVPAYGDFVGRLRAAIRASHEQATVSVATGAGVRGTAMAAAASEAGADRIFLMGYDYHTAGSEPGASAPLGRRDGSEKDLVWSLDLYRNAGVPAERTILGLPLYGMSWPTADAVIGAGATGRGDVWIPRRNLDTLGDPDSSPVFDSIENVEVLSIRAGSGWRAIYFDSPASLTPKLALADSRGLAGAGFWAIGYERGLPGYTELIETFGAGRLEATPAASSANPTAP